MNYNLILKSHDFSHKFLVKYAYLCAKEAAAKNKPNKEVNKCLDLVAKWLDDKTKVTNEELRQAAAATYATYATYAVTAYNAAAYAYYAAYAATTTYNAATYAYYAAATADRAIGAGVSEERINQILLDLIDKELTPLERTVIGLKT